ncbi:hypothetical protein [Streptomyces sp. RFCAC02]|uniref:hypothetical protein n=1 Tax=Streptomyces sp. RFCAC02 TaxID=2499143 RepID=UPI0010228315|nr:hypothetical protein [Streptomyces sp. RFCAC02]
MPERESELIDELRRAAGAVAAGPAPVREMIARGRALRTRRRVTAGAGVAGVLAAVLAAGLVWSPAGPDPADPVPPATPSAPDRGPGGGAPVEVRPYEPVAISDRLVMGLLPEGDHNYVISAPEDFAEDIEAARLLPGNNLRPGSVSTGVSGDRGAASLIEGAWHLDRRPARIMIIPVGRDTAYPATVVALAGEPDWGAYFFDASRYPDFPLDFRVVAYDENGTVLAEGA